MVSLWTASRLPWLRAKHEWQAVLHVLQPSYVIVGTNGPYGYRRSCSEARVGCAPWPRKKSYITM
ncbi:hypothetical protein EJB05_12715 [Eragrostis curvula]|uniref:Uncharacterized protein n=1 Tax=Eragrostis curvula TaxID=38414 RepID=A0A5J9VSB7_9POAL|nr:hypothetical protein EJB05_12715 [Eragrostis curvula]